MTYYPKTVSRRRRMLAVGIMVAAISAASFGQAASADAPSAVATAAARSTGDSGFVLAGKCNPPRKQEGCVRDPCTGNYICCDKTTGGLSCTTMKPQKK